MSAWAVNLVVEQTVTLPSGESLDRESFFGWLWDQLGESGLVGICEGALEAGEAAALGLSESARVLDVAAAPAERDWVGSLAAVAATCWFGDESAARDAAARLVGAGGCSVRGIRHEAGRGDDWKRAFGPIDVPGFGTIQPAWEEGEAEATPAGTTVFIDPGAGFGTGLHETTRLCLAALRAWHDGGGALSRVLDFGSGSGILGIAAAIHGAGHVDAVEIDERVHDAIRSNARRNRESDRLRVVTTLPADGKSYDLVFANIVASVLLDQADLLCQRVGRGGAAGSLVLCGLLAEDLPAVTDRYSRALGGLPVQTTMGEWHCLRFTTAGVAAS
ncbi:MAG: methyltransferase domain-containing protein [Planctomycetia bacterium]|nr:methyltransferase domain-containing protein [Planctomycetia bacterium]